MDFSSWDFLTSNSDSYAYLYPIQNLQISDQPSMPNFNCQTVTSHSLDGQTISCEEKLGAESFPAFMSGPYAMNQPISNFSGSSSNADSVLFHQVASFESLDCLLSSPASTDTDKSVEEDDEFSIILSDCRNLLNFGEASGGVSSEESEKKKSSKERKMDEPVSRSRYANSQSIISKRRSNQSELKKAEKHGNFNESCGGLTLFSNQNLAEQKKPRSEKHSSSSSNINFQQPSLMEESDSEAIEQMKEMMYRAAAFRPVNLGAEVVEKPKRKNVRISTDPQTVAARQRRERISERIRVLQKLVPGGSKMDTASMLDEAANYLKFLRSQVKAMEGLSHTVDSTASFAFSFNPSFPMQPSFSLQGFNQINNSHT